jgi:hypothetical protein
MIERSLRVNPDSTRDFVTFFRRQVDFFQGPAGCGLMIAGGPASGVKRGLVARALHAGVVAE